MRQQVKLAGALVPGLWQRTTTDGTTVYEARVKIGGKARRRTLDAQTATDAKRALQVWVVAETSRLAGGPPVGAPLTLRQLREAWGEWAASPAGTLQLRTLEGYVQRLDDYVLPILGPDTKAADVTVAHVRLLIDRLRLQGLSGSTVCGTLNAASSLFRFGVRRNHLAESPVRRLERGDRPSQRRGREPRYLSRPEIDRLLAALRPETRALAAILAFAALRISEALDLRWCDLDFDAGVIRCQGTKTEGSRAGVPMIPALKAELISHRTRRPGVGDVLVFRTANGNRLDRKDVLRSIYAAGDTAGLNPGGQRVGCHSLRHSCAGLLFAAGVPPTEVARVLRHSTTRTTLTVYAGLADAGLAALGGRMEAALGG
jgi:integrase